MRDSFCNRCLGSSAGSKGYHYHNPPSSLKMHNLPFAAFPESEESDLVPGVYEGGMKLWEASIDLVEYLASIGIGVEKQPGGRNGSTTSCEDGDFRLSAGGSEGCEGRVLEVPLC